jgi:glutamate N-acetyltransferase / amino-acid N-acetyltransferase
MTEAQQPKAAVRRPEGPSATFFRSRWVERPGHVTELEPTALPAGFRAAGVAAGIKPRGLDVGVLASDEARTVSAARFTTNARVGAPVVVSREARLDGLRAVVANSGCSNVGDGQRGLETARAMQAKAAKALGLAPDEVGVASTGVIGHELPRERVLAGVGEACRSLGSDAAGFSEAILTSDAGPKRACLEMELPGGRVRLAAQVKGAGMISPHHATMLCFAQTDARLPPETLDLLTGVCVKRSFDRISVDGQLSTSDTVFALASGASGVAVEPETPDELALGEALDALLRQLALEIVSDGEGARRVGRIVVQGRPDGVETVARSIADSPLVKTALHGGDPNFGRLLQAAGQAWPNGMPFVCDLAIEGRTVVSAGDALDLSAQERAELERAVAADEVEYELTIPGEGGETEVFFSDLSEEYVRFNSRYTS